MTLWSIAAQNRIYHLGNNPAERFTSHASGTVLFELLEPVLTFRDARTIRIQPLSSGSELVVVVDDQPPLLLELVGNSPKGVVPTIGVTRVTALDAMTNMPLLDSEGIQFGDWTELTAPEMDKGDRLEFRLKLHHTAVRLAHPSTLTVWREDLAPF
jgi:hypothetical protein